MRQRPSGHPARDPGAARTDWFQPLGGERPAATAGDDDGWFAPHGGDLLAPVAQHRPAMDETDQYVLDWDTDLAPDLGDRDGVGRRVADRDRNGAGRHAAARNGAGRAAPDRDDAGDGPGDRDRPARAPAKRRLSFWVELPILLVVALVLTFLIQTFVARVYVIPSGSMETTLHGNNGTGDRILVDKVVYDFHGPQPGDVVVFKGPDGWDQTEFFVSGSSNPIVHWVHQLASSIGIAKPDEYDLVKRVVAVGGQTVQCCDAQNRILVDRKPLTEPYAYWQPGRGGPATQLRFGPITVPPGYLWVMGDNRNNSDDSRYQNGGGSRGVVPVGNVIGKARTIIWPPSRWRGIGDTDAQTMALATAPGWFAAVPTGVGVVAAFPTVWFGRRTGRRLRVAAGAGARRRAR